MSRRFLRPLFSFWEPFINDPFIPKKVVPEAFRYNRAFRIDEKKDDPFETFDNFFKDQFSDLSKLKTEEKEFFEKHYPEKIGKKFNAFSVLGVDEKADIEKINDAYRTKAIKYHPKNDPTPEGQKKFQELSKAYNELMNKKTASDQGEDRKSLFEEFHSKLENFNNPNAQEQAKDSAKQEKVSAKPSEKVESKGQSQTPPTGHKYEH
jgi:DnaJ-domain-containing protein 1